MSARGSVGTAAAPAQSRFWMPGGPYSGSRAVGLGRYIRIVTEMVPSGAGSQFDSLSAPGDLD
jgi:hypothetical protein